MNHSGSVSRVTLNKFGEKNLTNRFFLQKKEPTSSSAPRFASRSSVHLMRQDFDTSFSLFCPAQAFPTPVFRLALCPSRHSELLKKVKKKKEFHQRKCFAEPTSSAAPRFAAKMSMILEQRRDRSSSLLCQAQGYPTPAFR